MDKQIQWNDNEILLYLGYRGQEIDDKVWHQIASCKQRIEQAMEVKEVYRIFSLQGRIVEGTSLTLHGDSIMEHLMDCSQVILMAVTLGAEVEKLMMRTQIQNMADALIMDACGSAGVEAVCNMLQEQLEADFATRRLWLTDRFSPGYGDLPLSMQGELCRILNTQRQIGLTVTSSDIMIPRKSVTAFLGVADTPRAKRTPGCEACSMFRNCIYRKEGNYCGK